MGIVCMYLAEISLELTFALISTNALLWERSPFPRAGHIYIYILGGESAIVYIMQVVYLAYFPMGVYC